MKEKFPSLGNEVTITEEMCDLNGHMNVIYYAQIFEDEFPFYSNLGFNSDYFKEGYSFFTLEMNIRYCLLYTSPSPRDRQKSRMPSSS